MTNQQLIQCVANALQQEFISDRRLRDTLAGQTSQSRYLTIDGNGVTVRLRGDVAANWTANNPVLAQDEIGIERDTNRLKIGDGSTPWADLPYWGLGDHQHNDLYYTEAEIDGLLAGKSDTGHLHDDRYYTQAEVDALVAGLSQTNSGIWIWKNDFVDNAPPNLYDYIQCDASYVWGDPFAQLGSFSQFSVGFSHAGLYRIEAGCMLYSPGSDFRAIALVINGVRQAYSYHQATGWCHPRILQPAIQLHVGDEIYLEYRIDDTLNEMRCSTAFGGGVVVTKLN